jgi:MFS family permease
MIGKTLSRGYGLPFYLAFLSSFLQASSSSLLLTPLPLYVEQLGGGPAEVGLSGAVFALSSIAFRPFMGRLADTRGRKATLLIGTTMFVLAPLGYALSTSIPMFLVARALQGIGIAAYSSAFGAFIADVTPPFRWGEALGLAGTAGALSMIVASPIGGALVDHVAMRLIFLLAVVVAMASLCITLFLPEPRRESPAPRDGNSGQPRPLAIIISLSILVPCLANLTLGVSQGTMMTFLPLFARDRGLGNAGFFFTMMSALAILSAFTMGRLSDRIGRAAVILPMFVILALGSGGLLWTYSFGVLLVMATVTGMGSGGARAGLESMVIDAAPARLRGTAFSFLYLCFDVGIGLGSMGGGLVASFTAYGTIYGLVGVLCLLTSGLFALATRKLGLGKART